MNRYETKGWEPSMKKLCCLLLSLMTAVCFFSGCQGKKDITIDVSALADDLKAAVSFEDELAAPNDTAFLKVYKDIDEADIAAKKVYVSSGATAEEIAVFEAKDEDAAGRIKVAVDQRIADQRAAFEDYNPKEQDKLSDPVLVTAGKYVILCVSDDNATAKKCIDGYTKG